MSYYEALADNIRISKKNGFTIYYPPCHICGASVEVGIMYLGFNILAQRVEKCLLIVIIRHPTNSRTV